MSSKPNIETSIVEAFILCVEHNLEAYDWALIDLETMCENDPMRGYQCIVKIAQSGSPSVASRLGTGYLKYLVEKSWDKIAEPLLEDAQASESMRYALSSVMAFGLYSGDSAFNERLQEFWERWNLREYYLRLCEISSGDLAETAKGFELKLGDLILRFRKEAHLPSHTFDFEALDITPGGKVRISGKIDLEEIAQWRDDLRNIFNKVAGTCSIRMGADSRLMIVIDIKKAGSMAVRVNYWVNNFILQQMVDLEMDQSFLRPVLEQLDRIAV
ncbi:MAG: hypothetical protein JST01_00155 [Cyanobacteria bacterium SZAS TMP-1]|nr:hypothetical protein [Cyanobacteria bacterium SZAS TMP-1]